ncbi:MAG: hypothetical protein ACREQJ_12950, partial [Candidatus Binatia bacterium]
IHAPVVIVVSARAGENPATMATGGKNKRSRRPSRAAETAPEQPPTHSTVADAEGFVEALDEVRATVIALLASLRAKELVLRERAGAHPAPGLLAGLSDIGALRVWGDRTLRTLEVLASGQTGEITRLLEELGEFKDLVASASAPASAPTPSE